MEPARAARLAAAERLGRAESSRTRSAEAVQAETWEQAGSVASEETARVDWWMRRWAAGWVVADSLDRVVRSGWAEDLAEQGSLARAEEQVA